MSQVMDHARKNQHPFSASWKRSERSRCRYSPERSKRPSSRRSRHRQRAPSRIRHARASAAGADRRSRCARRSCAHATSTSTRCARPSSRYLDTELENLVVDTSEEAKATTGFQRVVQRAAIHVQSSGREEVTGANVLVAIFAERESHAAYFLQEQDMTRYDAVNYISHGIAKRPGLSDASRGPRGADEEPKRASRRTSKDSPRRQEKGRRA